MSASRPSYDIAIVGGGLIGASLAVALAPQGRRIALLESVAPAEAAASPDERVLGLNAASHRIFEALGLWPAIAAEAEPILATHVSERGRFGVVRFTAAEAGLPALGYNVPQRVINQALAAALRSCPNVEVFCPAQVTGLRQTDATVRLQLADGELEARLAVAADGAQSIIRAQLGIAAELREYGQSAVVASLRSARPPAGVAYERFTPEGPIAVLPRPDGRCVAVWMLPAARAADVMALDDATFLQGFQEAFGQRLGRFSEPGRRQSFPLSRVMSARLTAARVAFAGNAAQTLHPVAAQGFNLGLRDVATLAELLGPAPDPGAAALLAMYAERREPDRQRIADFTDRLVRIFSNEVPGLRGTRHWGLLALDLLPPVKRAVMQQNLGLAGAVPQLARGPGQA